MLKTYKVTAEFDVLLNEKTTIAISHDSVAAAVRHMVRVLLPTNWGRNGMRCDFAALHVEVKEKETTNYE